MGECARAAGMRPIKVGKGRGWTKHVERPPGSAGAWSREQGATRNEARGGSAVCCAEQVDGPSCATKHPRTETVGLCGVQIRTLDFVVFTVSPT